MCLYSLSSLHSLIKSLLRPSDINSVIYFSDNAPEGLSNSLASLRHATKVSRLRLRNWVILRLKEEKNHTFKLGLIASSTPFITGRPVTLFRNENVHSSGAVGFALTGGTAPKSHIEFPGLKSITPPLIITRSVETEDFPLFEIIDAIQV